MSPLHTVIGAGPLGLATATALLALGLRVRIVQRGNLVLPPGASLHRADITHPLQLRDALQDTQVAYFCAQPAYTRWLTEFKPMLAGVVAACSERRIGLVAVSNLYMHAGNPTLLTERTVPGGVSDKGRLRAEMDGSLLFAHGAGQLRAVVVRAADFIGPGVTRSVLGSRVFDAVRTGRTAHVVGNPDQPHSYCQVPDLGRALAEMGQRPDLWGRVWHAPHHPAQTTRQLLAHAAGMAGQALRLSSMGLPSLYALGLFVPELRETVELMPLYAKPHCVNDHEWRAHLECRPTPLDDTLSQILATTKSEIASHGA